MKIGIDTSRVTKERLTGTEYYSIELIKAISEIDSHDQFILYAQRDPGPRLGSLPQNFTKKIMPFPKLWSQIRLSFEMIRKSPDVLFVPAHLVPIIHPKNTVVTLHDLGFKHFPELYSPTELIYHNWGMNYSAHHAKTIITDSEATKKDLVETYALPPDKIKVVYLGCDLERFKPGSLTERKKEILFIGRLEEKKNIVGMIQAYAILRKEKSITHKLILAGNPGFGYENIEKAIAELPKEIQQDIVQLGYISEADYIKRLQEADIFFFCSFFEGFGMPIIEAMACGTPVVTSNVTSMPEVAGNAALCVNPRKPLEMAGALSKLIHDAGFKKSLALKGRVRAKSFTWLKTAEKTLEIIHQAGN